MARPCEIVIVGLWAGQEQRVRDNPSVRLIFVDRDNRSWSEHLARCDLCVLMARFISHRHFDAVKRALPRNRIVVCHGSTSRLNAVLASYH